MTPTELREALAELGLSQAELARRASRHTPAGPNGVRAVPRWTIWKYCEGKLPVPAWLALYLSLLLALHRRGRTIPEH